MSEPGTDRDRAQVHPIAYAALAVAVLVLLGFGVAISAGWLA